MSGQKFYNNLSRRNFLYLSGLLFSAPLLKSCFSQNKKIPVSIIGANHKTGHLLRNNIFPDPKNTKEIETIIAGGGVSGLSAARSLKRNWYNDFLLFELDTETGGNSKGGKNTVTKYPLGAHYLPVPNTSFRELIEFLHEHNIITGFDGAGVPVYNEYYLCFEPPERLYYRGVWLEGLPPKSDLKKDERDELERFMALMDSFKNKTGKDEKQAFAIPLENSSSDTEFRELDRITMHEYLNREGFKSDFLHWYVNYCCKDDFGAPATVVSAWAGIHYFSARKPRMSGTDHGSDVLTWPEGNHFLIRCLEKQSKEHIRPNSLVYKIKKAEEGYHCYVFDVLKNESTVYKCKNVILATPQYVNKYLLREIISLDWSDFNYYPWLVANITINEKETLNGTGALCWDNVIYNSGSLGYVNACHQKLDLYGKKTVLTYYYNFSEKSPVNERKDIYEKDEQYWKSFIINDLKTAHRDIESLIEGIEIQLWGHGMICPDKGFKGLKSRELLAQGIDRIYFANSDVSGISIFEQAFYRGIETAKKIISAANG